MHIWWGPTSRLETVSRAAQSALHGGSSPDDVVHASQCNRCEITLKIAHVMLRSQRYAETIHCAFEPVVVSTAILMAVAVVKLSRTLGMQWPSIEGISSG